MVVFFGCYVGCWMLTERAYRLAEWGRTQGVAEEEGEMEGKANGKGQGEEGKK